MNALWNSLQSLTKGPSAEARAGSPVTSGAARANSLATCPLIRRGVLQQALRRSASTQFRSGAWMPTISYWRWMWRSFKLIAHRAASFSASMLRCVIPTLRHSGLSTSSSGGRHDRLLPPWRRMSWNCRRTLSCHAAIIMPLHPCGGCTHRRPSLHGQTGLATRTETQDTAVHFRHRVAGGNCCPGFTGPCRRERPLQSNAHYVGGSRCRHPPARR